TVAPVDIAVTIRADGKVVASGKTRFALPRTPGEGFDVGTDDGSAVSDDYKAGAPFPGTLRNIAFDFRYAARATR
ncbi:MAG: hypothetical protein PHE36_14540, partial [Novosphingobium sp.]|nr:hypothetical protein [Novosphingobium sp.]